MVIMQELLIETQTFKPSILLKEGKISTSGNPVVTGILATAEVKNGNGRYYARSIWEREIGKYDELIKERRALGELDHPESQIVNLNNVSHLITRWWWDGDHIMGDIEILPTPSGNILKALFENNVAVGVSTRGMGSVEQRGELLEVQDDFTLIAVDMVSTPSNPGSWMKVKTLNESINYSVSKYSKVNNIIREILCSKGSCPIN